MKTADNPNSQNKVNLNSNIEIHKSNTAYKIR